MRSFWLPTAVLALLLTVRGATAQVPGGGTEEPLWKGSAPGAQGTAPEDVPTLTRFLPAPERATGAAVVVAPGGGYTHLAMDHEGVVVARWLNSIGIAAFVLKYRLGPKYHHPVELGDAQRALRTVRSRAAEWRVDPARIGILGFSAGGHLASSASTHFDAGDPRASDPIDRVSSRPDFSILIYPVITLEDPYAHRGSRENLLGKDADPALVWSLSSERQVTPKTPPTFLVHTSDDATVPVENSLMYYRALRAAGVPAELHVFETGPHGFGTAPGNPLLSQWPSLAESWMRQRGLLGGGAGSPRPRA
jgi:acetyl esterase/lipase